MTDLMIQDNYITRREHDEFVKRMDETHKHLEEEDKEQNATIAKLQEELGEVHQLATSVATLATDMELMLKEQERQREQLEKLENRDGEKWRSVLGSITTGVITLILGFIAGKLGLVG